MNIRDSYGLGHSYLSMREATVEILQAIAMIEEARSTELNIAAAQERILRVDVSPQHCP